MVQSVGYFTGFETGDTSEVALTAAGWSVQSSIVRSGGYAYFAAAGAVSAIRLVTTLSTSQCVFRGYTYFDANPPAGAFIIRARQTTGGTNNLLVVLNTDGTIGVQQQGSIDIGLTTTNDSLVLPLSRWILIEAAYDQAAGGAVKVWINGSLRINTTHSISSASDPISGWNLGSLGAGANIYFDDIRVDVGGLAAIGPGCCIARQGKTGTPTNDAWTKNGQATSALCWSETPFGTTNNCSSSTSAAAQTMLVAPFSQVQAGYGAQCVGANDVINACKTALVGKRATSGNPSIRRRIGGANTDTAEAMTASDAYYDDGIWTTSNANLDSAEAGCVKAADANLTTIEDVWMMADVTPGLIPWTPTPQLGPTLAQ